MSIVLFAIGGILIAIGPIRYVMASNLLNSCLDDCFMHCTWCSLSQVSYLKEQVDLAYNMMYVWIVLGIVVVIFGICFFSKATLADKT